MNDAKADKAWLEIQGWIDTAREAGRKVETFATGSVQDVDSSVEVVGGQDDYLDAVIAHVGGIQVDRGWLRLLGSGCPMQPRGLGSWNLPGKDKKPRASRAILVGDDVLGGFFAINLGGLEGAVGGVCYFAPDTVSWKELDVTYANFLKWVFTDAFHEFYSDFRWDGWESEVQQVSADQALSIYPPLWTEGGSIDQRSRKAVPIEEVYGATVGT